MKQETIDKELDNYGNCPECGKSWDAGRIWKVWRDMKDSKYYQDKTDEELQVMEKESYSKPYHFSKLIGIEIREKYDGVSYNQCPFCKATWDRWTGELIKDLKEVGLE